MKKFFLYRLFAVMLFLIASLSIKSENSASKLICSGFEKDQLSIQLLKEKGKSENMSYKYDAFFIKI